MRTAVGATELESKQARVGIYPGQCDPQDAIKLRNLADSIVLQGQDGMNTAKKLASLGRIDGFAVDPAIYREAPPTVDRFVIPGLEDLSSDWIGEQRAIGLRPIYTPSRRIRVGDGCDLARDLKQDYAPDVVNVLALDSSWLTSKHFSRLLTLLGSSNIRAHALVLADPFDPLSEPRKVKFLRELLVWSQENSVSIDLLRTDMSGLRAVISGARYTGIGLLTSTRHLGVPFKGKQKQDFERRTRSPLVFVPKLMHWMRANYLGALAAWPDLTLNTCGCPVCSEAHSPSLARFDQVDPTTAVRAEIRDHDAWSISAIVDRVLQAPNPSAELLCLQNEAIELAMSTTVDTRIEVTLPPWFEIWQ